MYLQTKSNFHTLLQGKTLVAFLSVFLLFSSCSSKKLKGEFDSEKWKADADGCKGERVTLLKQVETIRLELIGVKEYQIRSILGRPDAEELMERSMKKYIYYITPGPKCNAGTQDGTDKITYAVTLNALGKVTESIISSSK